MRYDKDSIKKRKNRMNNVKNIICNFNYLNLQYNISWNFLYKQTGF